MAISRTRVIIGSIALVLVAGGSLYAFNATERFLIRDTRFRIATPDSARPFLQVTGVSHASVRAIESVFEPDSGQSLYLVPLDERLVTLGQYHWADGKSSAEKEQYGKGLKRVQEFLARFVKAGGKIYSGTDTAAANTPGR